MYLIIGIPLILISSILETTLISRYLLFHGSADIVMIVVIAWAIQERTKGAWSWAIFAGLVVGLLTGMPFFLPLISYLLITLVAKFLSKRIWQAPLLVMLALTIVGTIIVHTFSIIVLALRNLNFSFNLIITQITLPSILLNMLWTLPVYGLIRMLANRFYPKMDEV
jgi:rod shape-determining protein MreD